MADAGPVRRAFGGEEGMVHGAHVVLCVPLLVFAAYARWLLWELYTTRG